MTRLKEYYTISYKFVNKMWTPAKYLVLICMALFLTYQGVSYGHNDNPPDHNHIPIVVNEDGEPIFGTYQVLVPENRSNYLIGSLKAIDEDEDDTLTYSLDTENMFYSFAPGHKQPYGHLYTINSETGEVRTGSSGLDFEEFEYTYHPTYKMQTVLVKVEDGNGGSLLFGYYVFIEDVNDNAPQFSEDSQTLSISENELSGVTVGTVSASDADVFAGNHTYSIETEDVPFTIESSKRSGTIKTTSVLDYEATSSYTLTVKVDDGFGTDTIDVTINITNDPSDDTTPNNPPTFTDGSSTTRSIVENMPRGTDVGSAISATDSDDSNTLTYSLDVTGDVNSFSINSSTGQLSSRTQFDYENKKSYEVTVIVSDGRGGTDSISVTINITNDTSDDPVPNSPPAFNDGPSTTRSIQENTTSGTNIGSPVSATDADSGDTLEYTLGGPDAGSFSIVSTTGQLQTSAALDYETKNSYEVTVIVSDGRGGTDSISVTINITNDTSDDPVPNSPPAFNDGPSTTRSIQENTTSGTNIGSAISATDKDSGDTLEYTLSGTDAGSFSIVSTTGQLQTSAALDYETKNSYEVTVTVSDGNGGSDSITVTISVTNDTSDDLTTREQVIVIPPTDPVSEQQVSEPEQDDDDTNQNPSQQVSEPEQDDDLQQPKPEIDTESEPNYTIIPFDYEREGVGKVVFSELMLAHLGKYPQWIELYNTTDQDIDMNGWKIVGRYLDDSNTINILESQVISKSFKIKGKETGLIVSFATPNSRDRISNGLADKAYALQTTAKNFWNYEGLVLELQDAEGNPIDRFGNLNAENEIVWEIPMVVREKRISLIRRLKSIRSKEYNFTFGINEFGWFPAEKVERLIENRIQYYYGRYTDIGAPGYRTEDGVALPVKLSSFRSQLNRNGQIILSWVTESELDNAGFNILRSQSKQGPFVRVNPKLIQGAGTTGQRNSYTWTDTTAKPDVAYYYRIEDVSFSGFRNQLATVRTRGHVSASERYITQWGNLKKRN